MNVVSTTTLRNNLADSLKEVTKKKNYLLISKKGKVTSAIVNIDFFEELLALASKEYKDAIIKARKEYEDGEIFTHDQVFGNI